MAKSLKIQIEMAGAEEIKRQLEGVGEAGEKAFQKFIAAAQKAGGFNKLDPSAATAAMEEFGVKGSAAVDKVTQAVKSAGRMETLINALTGVENGLAKVQTAATAVDGVLGKALVRSLTTIARLLPLAFAAATVGSIVATTKALVDLDARAIALGRSIGDLARAEGIFKALGLSAADAAKAAGEFDEKMTLKNVKEAIANIDEFGRSASSNADWFKILQDAANGTGEGADLAREKLQQLGRLKIDAGVAQELDRISKSSASVSDKILQTLGVFEKMGNTAERNAAIFQKFGKEFGTAIIQALDAGVSTKDIAAQLEKLQAKTQAAAIAAQQLELAWKALKEALSGGFETTPQQLQDILALLNLVKAAMSAIAGTTIGKGILDAFSGMANVGNTLRELEAIGRVLSSIGSFGANVWNGFVQAASAAATAVLTFFANLPGQIVSFFAGLGLGLWNGIIQAAQSAGQMVLQFFSQLPGQIASFFAGFGAGLWEGIVSSAQSAWDRIVGFIERAINKVREFFGMGGGGAAGAGAEGGGFARGGVIYGRGSGTSDSNLAWVSRGEHIMPARAVRQPGVLQLLEALRRSGGNLRGVLDRMGHFAAGGMVSAPAFARGGSVGGMSNVTIQFPGLPAVGGLRASSAVVEDLRRSAALAQVRSGGRKPTRYT